ncbi:DUF2790 domain-containing protein [Azotobacter vinelandii DJ]|nr:DUF2790 domain-containing protein [Azotobacter vinelandii]GLK61449.1 hypothetical protein GCM10017624_36120 [Azotobacter vinelandii]SFX84624.1 Protein of unknown function [Azotobacter vinelandii]
MTVSGMKSVKVICAAVLLLSASLSMAENGGRPAVESTELEEMIIYSEEPEVTDYEYGMRLDIAEVVAMEYFPPEPDFCGVIPAQMTYEDSTGNLNTIRYLYPETAGCHDN